MTEETTGSIVDPKYAKRYRDSKDFIGEFIDDQCREDHTEETKSGKEKVVRRMNIDKMLDLAERNGGNVGVLRNQTDRPNAAGRIRMSVGNMLRARALKRHGLYNLDGDVVGAPREFLQQYEAPSQPTETMDGEKIKQEEAA